jgi:putative transposase
VDSSDPDLQALVSALLEDEDAVFDAASRRLRSEMPIYERLGADQIKESVHINLGLTVHVLRTGLPAATPPQFAEDLELIIAERIRAGVTMEQMIQGHNIIMGAILTRLIELGDRRCVPVERVLDSSRLLWRASEVMLQCSTSLMKQHMVDAALREQFDRDQFVRGLVAGRLDPPAIAAGTMAYHLDCDAEYHALRARPQRQADVERLSRTLQAQYSRGGSHALITVLGRECVGIVPSGASTTKSARDVAVALGPPMRLVEVSASFAIAARVLAWLIRRAESGTMTLPDLSWRLMVDEDQELNVLLRRKYLDPLHQDPALAPLIEESLRAHLANRRNVAKAAAALVVHPNTHRYRLRKYTAITGIDLESTDHLIELAWALEAARVVVPQDNREL